MLHAGIVVDGGRVAQFPAGGAPGPPSAVPSGNPPAFAPPAAALANAAGQSAPAAGSPTQAQVRQLLRQQAEAILAACRADPGALGVLRAQNPRLGEAVSSTLQERQGAPNGGPTTTSEGEAMKRFLDMLVEDYEARRKVSPKCHSHVLCWAGCCCTTNKQSPH